MDEELKKAEANLPKRLTLGLKLNVNDSPLAKKIELLKSISAKAKLDKIETEKKLAVNRLASKQLFKSAPTTTTDANANGNRTTPVPPKNNAKEPQVKANSVSQSKSSNSEANYNVKVATPTAEQKQASKKDNTEQHNAKLKQEDQNSNKSKDKKQKKDKSKQDKQQDQNKDKQAKTKDNKNNNNEEHNKKPGAELKPAGRLTITETRYQAMLSDLQQRYPECFIEPVKPLAIGIQFRLQETQLYSMSSILAFLSRYCATDEYKANILQQTDGSNKVSRVELDGSVSEIVKKDKQKPENKNKDNIVKQKKTNTALEQPLKKLLMSKEEYKQMLNNLQQKYPNCFSCPAKPLAIGIHLQLREKEAGVYSNTKIRDFLKIYCLMTQYTSCLIPGEMRVNLDGNSTTLVEEQVPKVDIKQ